MKNLLSLGVFIFLLLVVKGKEKLNEKNIIYKDEND
jgi:hypothetical protein